jgi:DNA-binding CsgD family transcriptional regulator
MPQLKGSHTNYTPINLAEITPGMFQFLNYLVLHKKLSKREATCLCLAGLGKTAKETAIILKIRPSTVEQYRKNVKEKLECKTIAHAVFKWLCFNFMDHTIGNGCETMRNSLDSGTADS